MAEQWTCGHEATAMCSECYRELARNAHALAEENEKLRDEWQASLVEANVLRDLLRGHERMERALRDIEAWARAYPGKVFHEPDKDEYSRAAALLRENGMTLDAFSASAMRHVLDGVINIVKDGLGDG